jgi:ribonucleotide reductase beta subunit family protein with ferritin-like domain
MSLAYHLNEISKIMEERESKDPTSKRYSLFPVKDEQGFGFYKRQEGAMWSANEMDFLRDKPHYDKLPDDQRRIVNMILGFFAPGDGLISKNIIMRFLLECETYEEMSMFIAQLFIELVHAETYGLTITTFLPDPEEQKQIFEMCDSLECVKAKTEWMERYMFSDAPKAERLAAFAIAEGLFFSMLFSIIFWFRSKNTLPMFVFSNEQISKDEGMHRDFGCMLFKRYKGSEHHAQVEKMLREAVDIEHAFIDAILPHSIEGLNKDDLKQYCFKVADSLLDQLGMKMIWNVDMPTSMSWMNDISMSQKNNFYELPVGSYKTFSIADALNWKEKVGLTEKTVDPIMNAEDVYF